MSFWPAFIAILGLALITVVTRGFFFLSQRELPVPAWLMKGLRFAPVAALAAVVVPEIVTTQGELLTTLRDARLFGAAAATTVFFWRRNILVTILVGMAVFLPLRLALGW
jgi:branched-subunit amino acid transport protein